LFQCGHGLECHHITLHVPEKGVWVTENHSIEARPTQTRSLPTSGNDNEPSNVPRAASRISFESMPKD